MADELFSRKETVKDIFLIVEEKLKKGLFQDSMEDLDKIMSMTLNIQIYMKIYPV